ncbi:hypothetical protein L0152_15360 [bacterium]|nr:hypothetical protein [bacterium]
MDENNVFNIGKNSLGLKTVRLSVQIMDSETLRSVISSGDLILLKIKEAHLDGLHRIESTGMSFSQDFGESWLLGLRKVDENLNLYPWLIS